MITTKITNSPTVAFESVAIGSLFEANNNLYIKIPSVVQLDDDNKKQHPCNAINLTTGALAHYYDNMLVHLVVDYKLEYSL